MANKKNFILPPGFEKRVIIAMGCQENVKAKTLNGIMGVTLNTKMAAIQGFAMRQGGDIVSARSFCVQYAREQKATHIFFVDSDMVFPSDTLDRLLAHDKEIVTVEYNRRQLPLSPVTQPLEEKSETELYKARVIGAGCLLINLSVFDTIDEMNAKREPKDRDSYFNFGRDKTGKLVIGEDTWFLNVAKDAGIDSWIDPTVKAGHIGDYEY